MVLNTITLFITVDVILGDFWVLKKTDLHSNESEKFENTKKYNQKPQFFGQTMQWLIEKGQKYKYWVTKYYTEN